MTAGEKARRLEGERGARQSKAGAGAATVQAAKQGTELSTHRQEMSVDARFGSPLLLLFDPGAGAE
jgi:hypothetical protein